jgi:hypothetical protein
MTQARSPFFLIVGAGGPPTRSRTAAPTAKRLAFQDIAAVRRFDLPAADERRTVVGD